MREQAEQNKKAWEYRAYEARSSGKTLQEKQMKFLKTLKP